MYTLRQLTAADRTAFRALRLAALAVNPDDFMMTLEEERAVPRLQIEDALEGSGGAFLGAFGGGVLIGVCGLLTSPLRKTGHVCRITSLFVQPGHRRRGVARKLVTRLLGHASIAYKCVRLEVVADNREAIALYESLGFITYGREPAAYRLGDRSWDLLLMSLEITPA